ncbi:alpha/beta hydrolase [Pseudooceanicola sp. HF7]|uniref:alpha/beta hydrolase n=1 Tax=Pseudooceanicola sp. HF7 TaxID=2721560 RepID=UPI00142FB038|nr:alpha/beta hydrolase-fold protein [Pseudooceanicola sp. HF7]NIZ10396.1 alpha/beta hydrolase [Pseudooceanicola sp. HF7]
MSLTRRAVLAGGAALLASPALSQSSSQSSRPSRKATPAEVIRDPRVSRFDIGPAEAPWRIQVGLPEGPPPPQGYSAIFALDGNASFPMFWHRLPKAAPVVLVGIGYPTKARLDLARRWRDLTSPALVAPGSEAQMWGRHETGGREDFADMILTALLPRLQEELPLDPGARTLHGHSLGGLFGLHLLFTAPGAFRALALADPSTWWNGGEAYREAGAFAGGVRAGGHGLERPVELLLMSGGASSRPGSSSRRSVTPRVAAQLQGLRGLSVRHKVFPELTHGGLISPSVDEALALHQRVTG